MKIQRFGNWLARRWLNLSCLLLIMVLLGSLGIQITNRSPIPSGLTTIGIGSSKIITIGSEAEAAGSVDYTYGAANANVQFQAALNALPATGGRLVIVSTGNVSFPALVAVTRAINNVTIEGSGRGTYFVGDGVTPPIIAGGNNWVFNNIRTNVTGAVLLTAMGATTGWMWTNVATSDVYYSYRSPTGQARFNDTTVASLTDSGLTSGRIPIAGVGGLLGDDGDLTFSGTTTMMTAATATTANITTLNADVGRAYTYIVAGADAPSNVRTQATYLADGVADDVQIQAALDAAYALGGKQKIGLFGTLTASTSVTPKSNVDVDLFGEVDLNFNTNAEGILFNGTVNSTWDGGIWRRQGTMIGATRTIYVTGASDRTLVFKNMKVYNDTTETSAMEGVEGFRIHGTWNGNSASPTLINVEAWGSQNSLSAQAAGIDISGYGNTPLLINVIGHAGQGDLSAGLMFQNATRAIIYNGIGYGTTTVSAATVTSGIQVWDTASPELNDCTGYGGAGTLLSYGLWVSTGAATPTINGGNFYGGTDGSSYNIGVRIDGSTSPKLNGVTGKPQEYSNWWSYDDANNGRWRPFASKRYQLISIYVYSWAAIPGVTLDLGTSVGGSEIAQNITLATGSEHYFNFTKVYLAADAYMYATPSSAVADDAFFVGYVVAHDEGYQMGLYLDTKGAATINSSSFFA